MGFFAITYFVRDVCSWYSVRISRLNINVPYFSSNFRHWYEIPRQPVAENWIFVSNTALIIDSYSCSKSSTKFSRLSLGILFQSKLRWFANFRNFSSLLTRVISHYNSRSAIKEFSTVCFDMGGSWITKSTICWFDNVRVTIIHLSFQFYRFQFKRNFLNFGLGFQIISKQIYWSPCILWTHGKTSRRRLYHWRNELACKPFQRLGKYPDDDQGHQPGMDRKGPIFTYPVWQPSGRRVTTTGIMNGMRI